jgi:hypothetical protein
LVADENGDRIRISRPEERHVDAGAVAARELNSSTAPCGGSGYCY